ncbi:hypothetical protein [Streptomyces sp. URMC 123]|uniref:hypothetical protein n=1 Tax=Streptomyces sp. URMC 123 TaxID=3423403 RepID=UPI003F1C8DE9
MPGDRITMPPVRLPSDAQLASDALSAPLFARAVRLARWAAPGTPVGAGGELLHEGLREAVRRLGLDGDENGEVYTAEAWRLAVDTGLVEIDEDIDGVAVGAGGGATDADGGDASTEGAASTGGAEGAGAAAGDPGAAGPLGADLDAAVGLASPGEDLALITGGAPLDVLDIWLGGLEAVFADAATPNLEDLVDSLTDDSPDGEIDLDALDWDPDEEADFLDSVLGNLYLLTVLNEGAAERAVPLPALAASVIVPDDMEQPTDEVLEQVSEAMMRLDDQFRLLAPMGVIEYQPVDEALIEELEQRAETGQAVDDSDVTRYGMVRLTPLGTYGVRARMLDAGIDAPAVGDLAEKGADVLLDALPGHPETAARAEVEQWLARRDAASAARELLAAGRGDDEGAPLRRLGAQQALSLVGPAAEPAVREVLDDRHLGGLARVWLAENGASDIPEPSEEMVFWLTVDTIAAQLAADGDSEELEALVEGLVEQHNGFFDTAWKVDHPATADVLEAMGRLHTDRKLAKDARKAAFKARSRPRV